MSSQIIVSRIVKELNALECQVQAARDPEVVLRLYDDLSRIARAAERIEQLAENRAADLTDAQRIRENLRPESRFGRAS